MLSSSDSSKPDPSSPSSPSLLPSWHPYFSPEALGLIAVVMLFIWGWNVVKNWFGITTLGAIFSGNVVIGVILFMIYLIVAYLVGIVFAFLGVGRWIYLKMKYRNAGANNG